VARITPGIQANVGDARGICNLQKLSLNNKVKLLKKAIMYLRVKFALEQDTNVQRGSRCVALLLL